MPSPELTPSYQGGSGPPLVLLHGINASWRVWQPVLPTLSADHRVFAPTLLGHHGGPALAADTPVSIDSLADAVELSLDEAGIEQAHLAGNSLGGWLAVELGRRGRALSVTALSPAGGWVEPRDLARVVRLLSTAKTMIDRRERSLRRMLKRPLVRQVVLRQAMARGKLLTPEAAVEMIEDVIACDAFFPFVRWVGTASSIQPADAPQEYPIRIAWGQYDRTIPFRRYGQPYVDALPDAEHLTLPGVGHIPMSDDPALVARTIHETTLMSHDRGAIP